MMPGLVFGVIGGIALAKFIARRRRWAHGYGYGHGGCGGRHAWRRGYDDFEAPRGFQVPRRPTMWLARELSLDEVQLGELDKIWRTARGALGRFGFARIQLLGQLAAALGDEIFDRPRVDAILAQSAPLASVRQEIADGLERLHLTLNHEQRERLRNLAGAGRGQQPTPPPTAA